jgi:hypothetical protein
VGVELLVTHTLIAAHHLQPVVDGARAVQVCWLVMVLAAYVRRHVVGVPLLGYGEKRASAQEYSSCTAVLEVHCVSAPFNVPPGHGLVVIGVV